MELNNKTEYLPVDKALQILKNFVLNDSENETLPVHLTLNRVTSGSITAKRDIPHSDNSAMDGFLFHKQDIENDKRNFPVEGEILPEHQHPSSPPISSAARIMTGAPLPAGDFIIVPVEDIQEKNNHVSIQKLPARNPIRKQGEGYRKGSVVLEKGSVIRPYEAGLLIESGNFECEVRKPIRIAIQVTGSEIDENRDSNGPVLEALASDWPGTQVTRWPVLSDDPEEVIMRLKELEESADLVITTGGISAGRHDYILPSIKKLGAEVLVRKIRQKPGKPFTVSILNHTPFFHLPGNPVSAVFTAEYYVKRFLYWELGLEFKTMKAITTSPMANKRGDKSLFLTARLGLDEKNHLTITAEKSMRSHLMQLYRGNDAYARLDPDTEYNAGDLVEVTPFMSSSFLM